ncbi:ribose transport system substrate-binding protein [Bradyrhizobium algeriense]|uniref:Ribose transport system substrate-binding protein n=1 Tax=Bradyrhizobium algeriense TaxID=634784 RepID=A0ABU8BHQ0_9BRAD
MTDTLNSSRRDFLAGVSAGGATATFGALAFGEARAQAAAVRLDKPLKAAFSNGGLQSTWCAQGKAAAEYWGKLRNVDVTWFDGELDANKQRAAIDRMASQKWDFVAIQALGTGTLMEPVQKMIDASIPVIEMETVIAPASELSIYSHLGADNETMGRAVTRALVAKLDGQGKIIMTQGPLDHSAAQERARGFESVVKQFPGIEVLDTQAADWDLAKVTRLWEALLAKHARIDAAFFHSDDMALAAYDVMKARGRTSILIGGIDAMPPALDAVFEGRMFATVRNPSCLIHGGAILAGIAAVTAGNKPGINLPRRVITDGPVVTFENAAGVRWLQDQFLI